MPKITNEKWFHTLEAKIQNVCYEVKARRIKNGEIGSFNSTIFIYFLYIYLYRSVYVTVLHA